MKKQRLVGNYICHECGMKYGKPKWEPSIASYYPGFCDYCLTEKIVTEPRDYWYPELPVRNTYDKSFSPAPNNTDGVSSNPLLN